MRSFVEPRPLLLVRDGRLLRANMRRELVTQEELESKLRENGVEKLADVRMAYLESSGEISLLLRDDAPRGPVAKGGGMKA